VVEIVDEEKKVAAVEVSGVRKNVTYALLPPGDGPAVGDYVLVHVGYAVSKLDEREAQETARILEGFGEIFSEPLERPEKQPLEAPA
jgi:hydrogenase expression/formation protein HypC